MCLCAVARRASSAFLRSYLAALDRGGAAAGARRVLECGNWSSSAPASWVRRFSIYGVPVARTRVRVRLQRAMVDAHIGHCLARYMLLVGLGPEALEPLFPLDPLHHAFVTVLSGRTPPPPTATRDHRACGGARWSPPALLHYLPS